MPAEVVEEWLHRGRFARISRLLLRPQEHGALPGAVLSIQCGQAEAFLLIADDARIWMLKKFLRNKLPNRTYLKAVARLVPQEEGFRCATERRILSRTDLDQSNGTYHNRHLAAWLQDTVLMPCVPGAGWGSVADELRDGSRTLELSQRIELGRNLCQLVGLLEQADCAHRDLSSGNVLVSVHPSAIGVSLIDFDSFFHPSLTMPGVTTCGTLGYAPSYAWHSAGQDVRATWCRRADRFALAILVVELLVLDRGAPLTADGGMFDQDELRQRTGPGIAAIKSQLRAAYQAAVPLFETALHSNHFDNCPSPEQWLDCLGGPSLKLRHPPKLAEMESDVSSFFAKMLNSMKRAVPLWPAPSLHEMPKPDFEPPKVARPTVKLPSDPWKSRT